MKRRILAFFVSIVLVLTSFAGMKAVRADGGLPDLNIHGPIKIEGSKITWEAYPGAAYYTIDPMDEYWGGYTSDRELDIEGVLAASSCRANGYSAVITAHAADGTAIARGTAGNYPYYPAGKMTTPDNPHWEGPTAHWNTIMDAESYKICLYQDGELIDNIYISGQNYADLSLWMVDYDAKYTFTVSSRKIKWEISDSSAMSPSRGGYAKRIAGDTRYSTGRKVAEEISDILSGGYLPLNGVVLANGGKFPDALGGAYLSWMANSPIILINENTVKETVNFVQENVKNFSTIYVLGGENAVRDSWLSSLTPKYNIVRLAGDTRYDTNLDILKTTGVPDNRLLVCTGENFADALSASAVSLPILLVNNNGLSSSQKEFLDNLNNVKCVILGGTAAVSENIENELKKYVTVEKRLSGSTRYETSLQIAEYFFKTVHRAVISTGKNFPDGLTGGLLAHTVNAPLILGNDSYFPDNSKIHDFLAKKGVFEHDGIKLYILGGEAAVPTGTVTEILNDFPSDY